MSCLRELTTGLLLISALPAQSAEAPLWRNLPLRRAEILDREQRGFRASLSAGKVVELVVGAGNRVPLLRPVSDWQIAELPGQVYVILAGGIRESLDLYLYEGKTGSIKAIGTDGGRLLPSEFGDQQGSWPLFEGRALVFFPYEKGDRLHFTVVNFQGQVLARRVLPLEVDSYRVEIDPHSYEVRISFDSAIESLTFLHPAAPRLVLDSGMLLFSGPERRSVILRNQGQRPLHVDLDLAGEGYRIIGPDRAVIPASSSREITVEMSPLADSRASLAISSPVPGAQAVVGLQNLNAVPVEPETLQGVVEPEVPPVIEASGPAGVAEPEDEAVDSTEPAKRTEPPLLDAEECADLELRRTDGSRVEVSGSLSLANSLVETPAVLVRNPRSGDVQTGALAEDGSFRISIAAIDGDRLECAYADPDGAASYRALGPILPVLSKESGALVARGRAGTELMLLEVITSGSIELPSRVLRSWRLATDSRGQARIPLSSLGGGRGPRNFMLLSRRSGGQVSQTQVLRVPGGFRQHR